MISASLMTDVPHPGEFIAEELDARGWLQRDLAYILGTTEQAVNMLVSGKRGVSPEMAKALGEAFDVAPAFFSNLQNAFEMARAREPDPSIAKRAFLQGSYPIREMIKRQWLEDTDVPMLEAQLMRFFRTSSLDAIPHLAHAAKKKDYDETTTTQLAWFYRARQICSEMVVTAFSERGLKACIDDLPRFMLDPEEVRRVPRLLADCGVRFAIVETLPKANIDGVCFWEGNSPCVAMSTRFDRIDNFWFVLRHELEHVLNRDGTDANSVRVDVELEAGGGENQPQEEIRANRAAAEFCVPDDELQSFYDRKAPFISERDVLGFSRRIQRHPGIVVGQLQRLMNRHDFLARYKVKIRQFIAPNVVIDGWGQPASVSL